MWYKAGEKATKCAFDWGYHIYEPTLNMSFSKLFIDNDDYHPQLFNNRISYLVGAGGTGKSHTVLDKLKDTLYITACWSLNTAKSQEYKVKSLSEQFKYSNIRWT